MTSGNTPLLNIRALLITVVAGIAAAFVIVVIGGVLIGGSALGLLTGGTPQAIVTSMGALGVLVLCLCCLALGLCIAEGALYAWLAHHFGDPLRPGPMALGGALYAMIAQRQTANALK